MALSKIKVDGVEHEIIDTEARASIEALKGITFIESTDTDNLTVLRDLESGTYVLYGYFKAYTGSTSTISFSSRLLVNVVKQTSASHVMVFYPVNNSVQHLKITDEASEKTYVYLNDLLEAVGTLETSVGDLSNLITTNKTSLVDAVNEVSDKVRTITAAEKYLFTGVELPALPEYDETAYPYAYIAIDSYGGYEFFATNTPVQINSSGGLAFSARKPVHYKNPFLLDHWTAGGGYTAYTKVIWANLDLYFADGTLYLATSEPVPVHTETTFDSVRYGDVTLPNLPDYDTASYPYVFLGTYDDIYMCFACKSAPYVKVSESGSTTVYFSTLEEYLYAATAKDGGKQWYGWQPLSAPDDYYTLMSIPAWSNVDIFYEDGSLALAASDPVPAEEEEAASSGVPETLTLTTTISTELEEQELTEEESALLEAAAAKGEPVIVNVPVSFDSGTFAIKAYASYSGSDDLAMHAFSFMARNINVDFIGQGGTWMARIFTG